MDLLSLITFLPLVGALLLLLIPRDQESLLRNATFFITGVTAFLGMSLFVTFDGSVAGVQREVAATWFSLPGTDVTVS